MIRISLFRPFYLIIFIFMSVGLFGCTTTTKNIQVGEIPVAQRPLNQDIYSTRSVIAKHLVNDAGYTIYKSGQMQNHVQQIVDRLAKASGATDFTYPVYIADAGDNVNAMAINDNTVVVYTALLERVENDDELATVLAHEIGHIVAQHSKDNTSDSRRDSVEVAGTVLGVLVGVGAAVAGVPSLANLAASTVETATVVVGEGAIVRAYDRAMEHEADQIGLMIMAKAGFDPQSAISFWERSDKIFASSSGTTFFSTHPSDSSRIEHLLGAMPVANKYYLAAKNNPKEVAQDDHSSQLEDYKAESINLNENSEHQRSNKEVSLKSLVQMTKQTGSTPKLHELPRLENTSRVMTRTDLLLYETRSNINEAKNFYLDQLTALGWQKAATAVLDTPSQFQSGFEKDGYHIRLAMSENDGKVRVMIRNGGNVDTRLLPKFPSAGIEYASPIATVYSTDASVDEAANFIQLELYNLGWNETLDDERTSDGKTMIFVKGEVFLHVKIASAPKLDNKTIIGYNTLMYK